MVPARVGARVARAGRRSHPGAMIVGLTDGGLSVERSQAEEEDTCVVLSATFGKPDYHRAGADRGRRGDARTDVYAHRSISMSAHRPLCRSPRPNGILFRVMRARPYGQPPAHYSSPASNPSLEGHPSATRDYRYQTAAQLREGLARFEGPDGGTGLSVSLSVHDRSCRKQGCEIRGRNGPGRSRDPRARQLGRAA